MSDITTFHIRNAAKNIQDSPSFQPFSMVRIIVGTDDNGQQLVYEAGDNTGRVLEVENPWGTQQMANDMLSRILGYQYKPYTAAGALIDPAAELGDAVTVGLGDNSIYSVINSLDTTISPIMSATIAAKESSNIEHEYPYEDKQTREIARKINGLSTSFTVELGKIESEINDPQNGLSSRITQLSDSITSEVQRATAAEGSLSSRIAQTANSITSEVQRATAAEGSLSSRITQTANSITSEVQRATAAEGSLSSRIAQTATDIRAEVNGIYADEWENGNYYYANNVVKVTDGSGNATYYRCKTNHSATSARKPPNSTYWEVVSAPSVQSMLNIGLDGLTLSYSGSELNNSAYVSIKKDGVEIGGTTITMSNVVANELDANFIFSDGMDIYGAFRVFAQDGGIWKNYGAIGASFGNDGVVDTKGCMLRSAYYRGEYNYLIATSGASGGVRMQAGEYSLYVTQNGVFASDGSTTRNLLS